MLLGRVEEDASSVDEVDGQLLGVACEANLRVFGEAMNKAGAAGDQLWYVRRAEGSETYACVFLTRLTCLFVSSTAIASRVWSGGGQVSIITRSVSAAVGNIPP